ncbi:ABC transporter permease subunit [Shinella kummerowiae]|jgi:iron(III) transport system permease protein|uniref:ABC transporter permease subunit n=2 Tax=Shinella kummerowiae TaxID=417745 RepID=A0A6N8SDB1_9HYPH|nr:ABC transporter permease subunit [Shinella kummerowiae]
MKAWAVLQDSTAEAFTEAWPARRRMGASRPHVPVIVFAALVAMFSLVPLGFIGWVTYDVGWETVKTLVFRPRVGELILGTLYLELLTIPLSIAVAVGLAWLTERTDIPGARLWAWLAITPLAVPAFVHSYAWVSLVPGIRGLAGGVFVAVLAYFPFLYLPVAAALRRLDPAVEDAAASLGLAPVAVFFRVVLPQLRLAICGGSLLIGLHLLSEYGLFAMIRFDTLATAIVDQFQSSYNSPAASMIGGVLVTCCLFLLGLEVLLRGNERYARIGAGAARPANLQRLGRFALPVLLLPATLAMLTLGVPLLTLGRWLWLGGAAIWDNEVTGAVGQTIVLALAGGILATMAAAPMAWLSVRAPGRLQRFLEACHYYVGSLPGVVVALALVSVTVRFLLPLYQTFALLLAGYVLLFLPRAMVGLRASIAQAPVELERAAVALGRTPGQAVRQITLRLAAPGAAASVALVSLGITNELTATLMLAPTGVDTLATRFWALTSEIDYVAAAPYAVMMVVLSLPLTLFLHAQSKRTAGQ